MSHQILFGSTVATAQSSDKRLLPFFFALNKPIAGRIISLRLEECVCDCEIRDAKGSLTKKQTKKTKQTNKKKQKNKKHALLVKPIHRYREIPGQRTLIGGTK